MQPTRATAANASEDPVRQLCGPQLPSHPASKGGPQPTAVVVSIKAALDFSQAMGGRQVQSVATTQNLPQSASSQ